MTSGLTCGFALGIFTFFNWIQETDFTNIVGGVLVEGVRFIRVDFIIYFIFVEQEGGGGGGCGYGMIKHQIQARLLLIFLFCFFTIFSVHNFRRHPVRLSDSIFYFSKVSPM